MKRLLDSVYLCDKCETELKDSKSKIDIVKCNSCGYLACRCQMEHTNDGSNVYQCYEECQSVVSNKPLRPLPPAPTTIPSSGTPLQDSGRK